MGARKLGFYWVKINGKWTIGEYIETQRGLNLWAIHGYNLVDDIALDEIDERIIERYIPPVWTNTPA